MEKFRWKLFSNFHCAFAVYLTLLLFAENLQRLVNMYGCISFVYCFTVDMKVEDIKGSKNIVPSKLSKNSWYNRHTIGLHRSEYNRRINEQSVWKRNCTVSADSKLHFQFYFLSFFFVVKLMHNKFQLFIKIYISNTSWYLLILYIIDWTNHCFFPINWKTYSLFVL